MVNSTIISKVFIGENEIKSILDKLKLNYEYGHNNESFWVYDNKETALIIEINKVDEFEISIFAPDSYVIHEIKDKYIKL